MSVIGQKDQYTKMKCLKCKTLLVLVDDLIFSKTEYIFVLEDKLSPGSNLASSGLRKMLV